MEKTVLITGSSRGIGAATAILLASEQYNICINYNHNKTDAGHVLEKVKACGVNAIAVQGDISVEEDVTRIFKTIDETLGPVTALVNNAAILLPQMRLEFMTAERVNKVLTTNVTGYFLCCREAVKRMSVKKGGRGGSIVNVSSAAARLGSANEYIDYAASKGAVDTLTRGLSLEVAGEGIRVNGVRPGYIYTDLHASGGEPDRVDRIKSKIPLNRGGKPEEVAQAVSWLLSDKSSFCTGSFIDLAGGK